MHSLGPGLCSKIKIFFMNKFIMNKLVKAKAEAESLAHVGLFSKTDCYCFFIGYARSGHSLVASIIDAHPNAVIAQEFPVVDYLRLGYNNRQIKYLTFKHAKKFYKNDYVVGGYKYHIPNQHQGSFTDIRVIGTKKGGRKNIFFMKEPNLLSKIPENTKFVHITRNPYDIMSAMMTKWKKGFNFHFNLFFSICDANLFIKQNISDKNIHNLRHEDFVHEPKREITKLCDFLGLKTCNSYLNDCVSIIKEKPHERRYEFDWSKEMIERVKEKIEDYNFLKDYTF
ncbi:MAG: hypothetical protein GF349_01950 [Candidatus Magasanikbacteria bacterium]|nr:hypothetical protein [Candidatus Magasanikbacteria bacterium]